MQPTRKIEGYDVRRKIGVKQQAFSRNYFKFTVNLIWYYTAASNKLRENKSNFFPTLYPSIKIKIVNETHIETQSQRQLCTK